MGWRPSATGTGGARIFGRPPKSFCRHTESTARVTLASLMELSQQLMCESELTRAYSAGDVSIIMTALLRPRQPWSAGATLKPIWPNTKAFLVTVVSVLTLRIGFGQKIEKRDFRSGWTISNAFLSPKIVFEVLNKCLG